MPNYQKKINRQFSVAPMMGCTDPHARYFYRLLNSEVLLYTEMVTTAALLHGDTQKLLAFDAMEHPVALQLGGSDPHALAQCARLGEAAGYDEINLNVGCPSDRVKAGKFGACLMLTPQLVADCVAAMRAAVTIPVTVKCRIGVDQQDSLAALFQFIETVHAAGCTVFIIHARKAWLSGLSPKENRQIPPLMYEYVREVKKQFPMLEIIINGGIRTVTEVQEHLRYVDGVMVGREVYANPWLLVEIAESFSGKINPLSRKAMIELFLPYIEKQLVAGSKLSNLSRHILGLFQGRPGARAWRRYISEHAYQENAGIETVRAALQCVE